MGSPALKARMSLAGKPTDHPLLDPHGRSGCGFSQNAISSRYDLLLSPQVRDGSYPLHLAVQSRAPCGVVEMLIKEDRGVLLFKNKFGETPIHVALQHGAPVSDTACDIAELLLQYSPSEVPKTRDERGDLPLHVAATNGCSVHVAKGLLEAWPASVHELSAPPYCLTPLELAVKHGKCSENVLRLLSISAEAEGATWHEPRR
jgi:ankyrin repeat protein